jgi:hypothetical protein
LQEIQHFDFISAAAILFVLAFHGGCCCKRQKAQLSGGVMLHHSRWSYESREFDLSHTLYVRHFVVF